MPAEALDVGAPMRSWRKSCASLRPSPSKTRRSFASLHESLELRADYSRYSGQHIAASLTLPLHHCPGKQVGP